MSAPTGEWGEAAYRFGGTVEILHRVKKYRLVL